VGPLQEEHADSDRRHNEDADRPPRRLAGDRSETEGSTRPDDGAGQRGGWLRACDRAAARAGREPHHRAGHPGAAACHHGPPARGCRRQDPRQPHAHEPGAEQRRAAGPAARDRPQQGSEPADRGGADRGDGGGRSAQHAAGRGGRGAGKARGRSR
jgi:hypothetical protein